MMQQLENLELGGVKQWILIRGQLECPLLLVLHGGPGSADTATASRYQRDLEKHFLVVNWDQCGAGKSGGGKLSVKQLVTDATELIKLLLLRFGKSKLYLLGHSWGSALGLLVTRRSPELVYGYIGVGQLVDTAENERLSFDYVQKRVQQTGNRLAFWHLRRSGPPPYGNNVQALLTQRVWLGVFRGFFYSRRNALIYALIFLFSKNYSVRDKLLYSHRLRDSLRQFWPEVETIRLSADVPSVAVPVLFCLGKHDITTPAILAERYFYRLTAPQKQLTWFDASAHLPNLEEPQKFAAIILAWTEQLKTTST